MCLVCLSFENILQEIVLHAMLPPQVFCLAYLMCTLPHSAMQSYEHFLCTKRRQRALKMTCNPHKSMPGTQSDTRQLCTIPEGVGAIGWGGMKEHACELAKHSHRPEIRGNRARVSCNLSSFMLPFLCPHGRTYIKSQRQGCVSRGGGGLGPKIVRTTNGLTRFSQT